MYNEEDYTEGTLSDDGDAQLDTWLNSIPTVPVHLSTFINQGIRRRLLDMMSGRPTPVVFVLPTCHGKSTLHSPSNGLLDAGELVEDKEGLRALRATARSTGNWLLADDKWEQEIKERIPTSCRVLMVPHPNIAKRLGLSVTATFVLPKVELERLVAQRPKSGLDEAMKDRDSAIACAGDRVWELGIDTIALFVRRALSRLDRAEELVISGLGEKEKDPQGETSSAEG